jgi:anti-sigma regulatory factor (Ser/Thr protein kinase)
MARATRQNPEIREFLLRNVTDHPAGLTAMAVQEFGLSRMAILRYVRRLIDEGLLTAQGTTSARRYALAKLADDRFEIKLSAGFPEDTVWRFRVLPHMNGVRKNVLDICQYGFTEMLNNAIDHSVSPDAIIAVERTYDLIQMTIIDRGVGIFEKIQKDFALPDPRSALLELSKGRLTSDAKRHSGEGIFFTSRMFDDFSILSGSLNYARHRKDDSDWLIETEDRPGYEVGTGIRMKISSDAPWTMREVFDRYQNDGVGFRKTHVPVKLGKYPGEQLVSRSQAKRVLARFDQFSEVFLDFNGVDQVGQAFADEIFRVFRNSHPDVNVVAIGTNDQIERTIRAVQEGGLTPERAP